MKVCDPGTRAGTGGGLIATTPISKGTASPSPHVRFTYALKMPSPERSRRAGLRP